MPKLSYPDSTRRGRTIEGSEDAIAAALRDADTDTVEVHADGEDGELLARYEKRDEPIYADENKADPDPGAEPEPAPEG